MRRPQLADMALTETERLEAVLPPALGQAPQYPWGLRISLTEKELEKLGLDIGDCEIGDLIDIRAFGTVTSLSQNDGPDGPCCRVEIQLQEMTVENEMTEPEMAD